MACAASSTTRRFFYKHLQFFIKHLRLLHVDEVTAGGQLGVVEIRVEGLHFLLVVGLQAAVLRADNHYRQGERIDKVINAL